MRANEVRTANRRRASLVPLWVNLCGLLIFGQSSCDAYRESRCTAKNVFLTIREACIHHAKWIPHSPCVHIMSCTRTLLLLSFVRVHEWKKQDYCKSDTQHPFYLLKNKTIKHRLRKPLDSYRPKLNVNHCKPSVLLWTEVTPQKCEEEEKI